MAQNSESHEGLNSDKDVCVEITNAGKYTKHVRQDTYNCKAVVIVLNSVAFISQNDFAKFSGLTKGKKNCQKLATSP